jgi:nucleoside-diphosphate-sugar epimerase
VDGPGAPVAAPMNILVTGGSGKLGGVVVADLVAHGHNVLNADLVAPVQQLCPFVQVDLQDSGQVVEAVAGIDLCQSSDAIVHLAATAAPGRMPNATTFKNNVTGTYNVFEAARRLGVRNIVYASTEIIFGLPFTTPPSYLPVDEESPPRPESAYGLSKLLAEQMAVQFCRRDPELKMFGLRFSNVQLAEDYAKFPSFQLDPYERRWNLWGYIDARDGAQAVRKALESALRGPEVFIVANAETVVRLPNAELVRHCFPSTPLADGIGPNDTLLSIEKAGRLLGYEPQHHWWNEQSDGTQEVAP